MNCELEELGTERHWSSKALSWHLPTDSKAKKNIGFSAEARTAPPVSNEVSSKNFA
jgi:hypothetical protein